MSTITRPPEVQDPPRASTDSAVEHATDRPRSGARALRGRVTDPSWYRPAVLLLLAATAVLYLVGLSASGYGNSFYAAAAQAGSQSWKAFFYGSLDAGNSITVDKPPASLWVMGLSVRLFGLSSWSILAPQALMGVASVGVLVAAVRRSGSHAAAIIAGAVLALTPVMVLMSRFDNPDTLLVLLMTAGAYTTVRACASGRTRWMVLTGVLLGLGFLTKQLQALLVVPAFATAYLLAAPTSLWRRVRSLLAAGLTMVLAAGWWVAIVELVPASMRPYIGGSQTNSFLELTFGYNGLGRLTGDETGSVGGGTTSGGNWGATGITRLFTGEFGGQAAWLLPAALVLGVAGLVWAGRRPRTDAHRVGLVLWGGWLLVTALTFSFMAGVFHAYYTVALAPAIAALVGLGATRAWARRSTLTGRVVLAAVTAGTTVWSIVLLGRADWHPELQWVVGVAGALATAGLLASSVLPRVMLPAVVAVALVAGLAGPAEWSVQTAATAHTGSIVTAGPAVAGSTGMGGPGGGGAAGGAGGAGGPGGGGTAPTGTRPTGTAPTGTAPTGTGIAPTATGGGGGAGGLLNGASVSTALTTALKTDASSYTWAAATIGAQNAASYQLASGAAVMATGGFNGTDPSPTLAQFQADVAAGLIHWFVPASTGSGAGASTTETTTTTATSATTSTTGTASAITAWVAAHYTATTVGGTTVYDLTAATT